MRKRFKLILVFGCLSLFAGSAFLYLGHKAVKAKGYAGIKEYLLGVSKSYANSLNTQPDNIRLSVSENTMAEMGEQREKALKENLMLNIGENYHRGELSLNGKSSNIEIRLKGHMTDHLQENKWSFRIKNCDPQVLGLSKFTLQHPGTRNYVYEWVFHRLARQEGIVHLDYRFVNVEMNGESWGIYALEEHFGDELLKRNKRPKGVVVRFDPAAYWQGRLNEKHRLRIQEDYADYVSTNVDVFSEGKVYKDDVLKSSYERAIYLLESFRRDKLKTSEVFDVLLMAKYLAIIDLVGGYHSLDWSDVKFYMNSETNKLEPVAYESFGVRQLPKLAGAGRYLDQHQTKDFHQQLFSDPIFFEAYMKAVQRICSRTYFEEFLNSIQSDLNHQQAILANDFPLKPFTPQTYLYNINVAKRSIDLPNPLTTYVNDYVNGQLVLVFHNACQYPIRITSIGEDKLEPVDIIIPPKQDGAMIKPKLHLVDYDFGDKVKLNKLKVQYEVPGGKSFSESVKPFKFAYEGFEEDLRQIEQTTVLLDSSVVESDTIIVE